MPRRGGPSPVDEKIAELRAAIREIQSPRIQVRGITKAESIGRLRARIKRIEATRQVNA